MTSTELVARPAERGAEDWGKTPPRNDEQAFLDGPRNRPLELLWVLRTAGQFVKCFRQLHFVGPCVTVFGSARVTRRTIRYYAIARRMGCGAWRGPGFTVMTGGGPGVMEAANRGAKEAGGRLGRLQHRAAAGAEAEPLPRPLGGDSATSSSAR